MKLLMGWLLQSVTGELGVATLESPQRWLEGLRVWVNRPSVQSQLRVLLPLLEQSLGPVTRNTAQGWAGELRLCWEMGQPGLLGRGLLVCQLSVEDDRWLSPAWGSTPQLRVARALAGLVWFLGQPLPAGTQRLVRDVRSRGLMVYPHDRLIGSEAGWQRVDQAQQYLQAFWRASQEVYREQDSFRSAARDDRPVPDLPEQSTALQGVIYRDPHSGIELFALPALVVG